MNAPRFSASASATLITGGAQFDGKDSPQKRGGRYQSRLGPRQKALTGTARLSQDRAASGGVNRHIVILIASAMHLSWAAALLFAPLHTTGIELVLDLSFGSNIIAAILCAVVSLAAVAAIFCRNLTLCVFLVLPQQFLLIASAIGAVFCVIDGKFADGAVYPRPFIFVDQIYLVLLCVAHGWQTMALWREREFAERR